MLLLTVGMVVGLIAAPAFSWQGRMGGMGDPYGLILDESDFLVHPSKVAGVGAATGIKWYGHYGFLYKGVTDWNWDMDLSGPITFLGIPIPIVPGLRASVNLDHDGNEYNHQGLVGATFPIGVSRMGLFFTYNGKRGNYDGSTVFSGGIPGTSVAAIFDNDLESDLDNFSLRAIFGLPITKYFKMGAELQVGYQREEDRYSTAFRDALLNGASVIPPGVTVNFVMDNDPLGLLFPFMLPHDSRFWEIAGKMGAEGQIGAFSLGLTLRGGVIVAGENEWEHDLGFGLNIPGGITVSAFNRFDMDGDISGWKFGGDLWARAQVSPSLSLPFVLRADYQTRQRDGSDIGAFGLTAPISVSIPLLWRYDNDETRFNVEVGGGVDWMLTKATRVGAGLYYNYIYGKDELLVVVSPGPLPFISVGNDFGEIPTSREHQVKLRLTGETELGPTLVLRGGLQGFLGWVQEDYRSNLGIFGAAPGLSILSLDSSPDGTHWGVMGSLGASAKMGGVTLEPFVTGGYQEVNLDGGLVTNVLAGIVQVPWDLEKERREWLLGGGLSILFGP